MDEFGDRVLSTIESRLREPTLKSCYSVTSSSKTVSNALISVVSDRGRVSKWAFDGVASDIANADGERPGEDHVLAYYCHHLQIRCAWIEGVVEQRVRGTRKRDLG